MREDFLKATYRGRLYVNKKIFYLRESVQKELNKLRNQKPTNDEREINNRKT